MTQNNRKPRIKPRVKELTEDILGYLKECQKNRDDPAWAEEIIEWCRDKNLMPKDTDEEKPVCQKDPHNKAKVLFFVVTKRDAFDL
jgi:hypothetical protein